MQELLNKLTSEVGLNAEQAQKTMSTVMDFVKSKLPASLSGNLDAMFSGNKGTEMPEEGLMDKASDFAEAAKDKLADFADDAKDKISDFAEDALGKLKGMFGGGNKEA